MRQANKIYDKGICMKSKSNAKAFWSPVRQKLKTKSSVVPLLENNKDIESMKFDNKEKANTPEVVFQHVHART